MIRFIKKKILEYDSYGLFSIMSLLFILSSTNKIMTIIGLLLFLIFAIYGNVKYVRTGDVIIAKLIVTAILFQNFFIGIGAHVFSNNSDSLSLVTQFPFLLILISGIFSLVYKRIDKRDIWFLVFLILCTVYCFIGKGSISVKLVYFRNFTAFYFVFLCGKHYLDTKEKIDVFLKYITKLAVLAGVFGILISCLGESGYEFFGVNEIYIAKRYTVWEGLPGNFYTMFNGKWVSRMASFYFEPVNFSYFMAFSAIISFCRKKWKIFVFLILCEFLTFGKGGWFVLIAFLGVTLAHTIVQKIFDNWETKKIKNVILLLSLFGSGCFGTIFYLFLTSKFGGYLHFYGLITAVKYISERPWGYGMGSAGNLVKGLEMSAGHTVAEAGLANMGYQIGVFGMALFIGIVMSLSINITAFIDDNKYKKFKVLATGSLYIPFILLLVFLLQENTFSIQCMTMYMLILGALSAGEESKNNSILMFLNIQKDKLLEKWEILKN